MKIKPKKCKGTGKAKGYGCGREVLKHTYGLGHTCGCYPNWLYNTDAGAELVSRSIIQAKKEVKKEKQARTRKQKEAIKTLSQLKKEAEKYVNAIVRKLDQNQPCLMCGCNANKLFACHYHAVGGNDSLRFNLFNIWGGCYSCNGYKGGNIIGYDNLLIDTYGREKWEYIKFDLVRLYPSIKLSREDVKELKENARDVLKSIEDRIYSNTERWEMRREINKRLGIY